ncbi:aldehyde oxidase GLOX-like [Cornus florida]|uniref:aldehyde oxidase GLOX-like n=1 Tax=Cornus florida TaxID=4283 RepID=UPI00289BE798|nr:aldehyde oxidase GLOX-like [Cornus florida]
MIKTKHNPSMPFKNLSFLFSLITILSLLTPSSQSHRSRELLSRTHHAPKFNVMSTIFDFNVTGPSPSDTPGGQWVLLQKSIGISAMHMQLLNNNKVVIFDRTDFGTTPLNLPHGQCRHNDAVVKVDCTAHSIVYDVASNTFRPLAVQTNVWCSSGAVHPNGTLIQTGGYLAGDRKIRLFSPCYDLQECDWVELPTNLTVRRWYSSNHILPDGRVIIVGGRGQFSYEFFPKNPNDEASMKLFPLHFLIETMDWFEENNLYPFLHLLPDGNLYIFANQRSISLDYANNRIVREFPAIPGEKRNYPATGSSVLLPLRLTGGDGSQLLEVEVMICGGARGGSYTKARKRRVYVEASKSCGRLKLTDSAPQWVMEEMPMSRVMPDMLLLPTGDVLILNGASHGTAGWEVAVGPVLNPVLYRPYETDTSKRFTVLNSTSIPRMYHSAATLLPDGRILVGGSNPHPKYVFTDTQYPTELSLEAFLPHYMAPQYATLRPSNITVEGHVVSYGQQFAITLGLIMYRSDRAITVAMIAPSFTTHSFAMNQRLLALEVLAIERLSLFGYKVTVFAPPNKNIAPPGYYMLFVVNDGIPGHCVWIRIN